MYVRGQVAESIQRQDELVARIESAHAKFQQETQQHGTSARDTVMKELAAGFDTYQELMGNLQEGTQVCYACAMLLLAVNSDYTLIHFLVLQQSDPALGQASGEGVRFCLCAYHRKG